MLQLCLLHCGQLWLDQPLAWWMECVRPQSPLNESEHQLCLQPPRWSRCHIVLSLQRAWKVSWWLPASSDSALLLTSSPVPHIVFLAKVNSFTKRSWIRITPLTDHILSWLAGWILNIVNVPVFSFMNGFLRSLLFALCKSEIKKSNLNTKDVNKRYSHPELLSFLYNCIYICLL